jgi:hypothetical protein
MVKLLAKHNSNDALPSLVRGKYVARLQASSNVVVLHPEIADVFPNAAAANAALRSLAGIARRAAAPGRRHR